MESLAIEVWMIRIQPEYFRAACRLLDCCERTRVNRFHFDQDRVRYAVSHGAMRLILSAYTGVAPESLAFQTKPSGKPAIIGSGPQFNLSHSGNWACIAIAQHREVGIDIERVENAQDMKELFVRYASPQEKASLAGGPTYLTSEAFYAWWTRKEAMLKCVGCGLGADLPSYTAWLGIDQITRWREWSVGGASAAPGYKAAIAARAPQFTADTREFSW